MAEERRKRQFALSKVKEHKAREISREVSPPVLGRKKSKVVMIGCVVINETGEEMMEH